MEANTLPTTATPSVPPSSRVVSLTAEPTPARSGGNEPMIDSVAGAVTRPSPPPIPSMATTTTRYGELAAVTAATRKPEAIKPSPAPTTRFEPNRRTSSGDTGAVSAVKSANGTVCTPADKVL